MKQSILSLISDPSLNFDELPAFLRVLLMTDGTVTKSLEAFFWEPVAVQTLKQEYIPLACTDSDLNLAAGDKVLSRQVHLIGEQTERVYVFANSLVCTAILPDTVRSGLERGHVGIGELLLDCGLETYRKVLKFGAIHEPEYCVWRSYLITRGGLPFIKIQEYFPLSIYKVSLN